MPKSTKISPIVDGLLRVAAMGGLAATMLVTPNALQLLDKPLRDYFSKLDDRGKQRELKRLTTYMRSNGLVSGSYEHGLEITDKARERLTQRSIDELAIDQPDCWDKQWRIVFYDIPEKHKAGRDALTSKLRELGCYQLQRSVWLHPFPCKEIIETIASSHELESYITYIETSFINNEQALFRQFAHLNLK